MEKKVDERGRSLLNFFVQTSSWNIDRLKEIIRTGVNLNEPFLNYKGQCDPPSWSFVSESDKTPLHMAAMMGDNTVVEVLLDHGAKVEVRDRYQNTPLHAAASAGNHETVQLLLRKRASVFARNLSGNTPLHVTKYKKVAETLIRNGASVREKNNHNQSALHCVHSQSWQADGSLIDITKLLLEHGVDVDGEDKDGQSPLHFAMWNSDSKALSVMIRYGANVNKQDNQGWTPLHWAVQSPHEGTENVELLLNHGALVDIQDERGDTPLHRTNSCKIAVMLLRKGTKLDIQNREGWTALHSAVRHSKIEIVAHILAYGFSTSVKDRQGRNALNLPGFATECKRLVATHIHLSNLAGVPVSVDVDIPLSEEERVNAVQELSKIKITNISQQVSLHDIFAQFQRPRYLLYEGVIEDIELFFQSADFNNRFPIYAGVLKGTFIQSKKSRYYLTKRAIISMMSAVRTKCCQLTPDLVWEQVCKLLSLDDLSNIIHSEL